MIHSYPFYLSGGLGWHQNKSYTQKSSEGQDFRLIIYSYLYNRSKRYWTSVWCKTSGWCWNHLETVKSNKCINLILMEESNITSRNGSFWALIWRICFRGRAEVTPRQPQPMSLSNVLNCSFKFNIFQTFHLGWVRLLPMETWIILCSRYSYLT